MTTMPSPKNAGQDHSLLLKRKPPHLLMKNYLKPTATVKKPSIWAMMATRHPVLPKPLQQIPSPFPPPDPSTSLEKPQPPQVGPS